MRYEEDAVPKTYKPSTPKKFKLANGNSEVDKVDEAGKIRVTIVRIQPRGKGAGGATNVKGNITKTITIHDAKVSEVYEAIKSRLCEG